MPPEKPSTIRYLEVHTGEVERFIDAARAQNCPWIREMEIVPTGMSRVVEEPAGTEAPIDWVDLWRRASQLTDPVNRTAAKLTILGRLLRLEGP